MTGTIAANGAFDANFTRAGDGALYPADWIPGAATTIATVIGPLPSVTNVELHVGPYYRVGPSGGFTTPPSGLGWFAPKHALYIRTGFDATPLPAGQQLIIAAPTGGYYGGLLPYSDSYSYSYTITMDVEEIVAVTEYGTWPNPPNLQDGPYRNALTWFEIPRAGGSVTVSCGPLSVTHTIPTIPINGASNVISLYPKTDVEVSSQWLSAAGSIDGTLAASSQSHILQSVSASAMNGYARSGTWEGPDKGASLTGRLRAMDSAYPSPVNAKLHYSAKAVGHDGYPTPSEDDVYTDSSGNISRTDPQVFYSRYSYRYTYTEERVENDPFTDFWTRVYTEVFNTTSYKNELKNARITLDGPWLASKGEWDKDTRVSMLGFPFRAFTLAHTGSISVAAVDSLTGWSGTNATLSLNSGIQVVAGASARVKRWFETSEFDQITLGGNVFPASPGGNIRKWGKDFTGHRYLDVAVKSVAGANRPFRLTLIMDSNIGDPGGPLSVTGPTNPLPVGVLSWDVQTGAANTVITRRLDLTAPTRFGTAIPTYTTVWNGSAYVITGATYALLQSTDYASDAQDTLYPLPRVDGPMIGVNFVTSIEITDMLSGETYVFSGFTLARDSYAKATLLPTCMRFDQLLSRYDTPGYRERGVRGMLVSVDGRMSVDEPVLIQRTNHFNQIVDYTQRSFANLALALHSRPAWTVTNELPTSANQYPNRSMPSVLIGGMGCRRVSGAWQEDFDVDVVSSDVNGQTVYDEVAWYPWIGDAWDGGSYGGPMPINFNKILRGSAWGTVITSANAPNAGKVIEVRDAGTNALEGQGTAGSDGVYHTGSPHANIQWGADPMYSFPASHKVLPSDAATLVVTVPFYPRRRHRASFRYGGTPQTHKRHPHNLHDQWGRFYETSVDDLGDVRVWRADFSTPAATSGGWAISSVIVAGGGVNTRPVLFQDPLGFMGVLYAIDNLGVWERRSFDGGASWIIEGQVLMGRWPFAQKGSYGELIRASVVPGVPNTIAGTLQHPGHENPVGPFTFVDNADAPLEVADDAFSLTCGLDRRWVLSVVIDGETESSQWESWDAAGGVKMSWKRIVTA